jgi:hypothetical protein
MVSSSRSMARRAGRWRVQPSRSRRIVQVWVGEYRTPVTFSITSATRARVHMSVGYPFAFGPSSSAASTSATCSSDSRGGRPARPAPARASRPPDCQARYHRDAVCADTSNSTATSTCRLPRANMSAARMRRSRNASKSRRAGTFLVSRACLRVPANREGFATPGLSYPARQSTRNDSPYYRKIFNLTGNGLTSGGVQSGSRCGRTKAIRFERVRVAPRAGGTGPAVRQCAGLGASAAGGTGVRSL